MRDESSELLESWKIGISRLPILIPAFKGKISTFDWGALTGLLASVFLPQVLPTLPGYKISYGRRASRIIHHPQQLEQAPQWLG